MGRNTTIFGIFVLLIFLIGFYSNALGATLLWDASPGEVTGYRLYYSTSTGSYSDTQRVEVINVTSYSTDFLPLAENTLYYFVVTAYNSAGESGYSNEVFLIQDDNTPPGTVSEFEAKEVPE